MKNKARGRRSNIDKLPAEIKEQLDTMLQNDETQTAILDEINTQLKAAGLAAISKSGLNRYATQADHKTRSTRPTRGKPSKIDQLPDHLKDQLNEMLRGGYTQKSILEHINARLSEGGDDTISRSSLNRYSTRMESIGKEIREVREMADVWVARLGNKPSGDVSKLLIEMMRTNLFKFMSEQSVDPDAVFDPDMFKDLALGIQRMESAAMQTHKREAELRKAFAVEAAAKVDDVAKTQGLTREGVKAIKEQILGIV